MGEDAGRVAPAPGKATLTARIPAIDPDPAPSVDLGYLVAPPIQRRASGGPVDGGLWELTSGAAPVGQPLDRDVQARMEHAFGADFSDVRVREDAGASALGALAYAQGEELHFAPGQYRPASAEGLELLGHELTHVVQQRRGRAGARQAWTRAAAGAFEADPALEAEADALGARAARGEPVAVRGQARGVQPKLAPEQIGTLLELLRKRYPEAIARDGEGLRKAIAQGEDLDDALDRVYEYMGAHRATHTISPEAEQAFDVSGRLALAAQAIAHAKQQFDHGAGNQLEAQWVSLGNAGQRADATKGLNPIARAELPSEHAQAVANDVTAVGIGRGGTCRQYAAIVYAFLVGKVPGVSMVSAAGDHVFVVIGDLAREADQTLVAADAWPSVAQAMRLSEHFSGGKAKVKPTLVDRELPGGQVKPAAQLEERLTAVPDPSVGALLGQSGLELAPTGARSLGLVRYQVDDGRGRMRPAASSLHVDQDAPLGGSAAPRSPDRAPSSVGPSDRDLAPSGPASRRAPPASSGGLKQAITELGAAWEEHDDDERLVAAVLELSIGSADVELVLELVRQYIGTSCVAYERLAKALAPR